MNELLQQDDCELADEYKSSHKRFRYKYNNSYFWTTLDDWLHHHSRPHLYIIPQEQQFREYLESKNIEFTTQKTFDDLKSSKNYKLRFDFYLPQMNLLVEIDDRSHTSNDEQVENLVTVVFGIAGANNEHLELLSQIALYCSDVSNVAKLADATTKAEIINLLKEVG